MPNRHIATPEVIAKEAALQAAIESFQNRMPSVFDPFAGGGAIPLEAARLGCRSYGNDINPVAHIIEKGSVEFPQKYGKPIIYSREEFMSLYGEEGVKLYIEKFGVMPTGEVDSQPLVVRRGVLCQEAPADDGSRSGLSLSGGRERQQTGCLLLGADSNLFQSFLPGASTVAEAILFGQYQVEEGVSQSCY